MLQAFVPLLTGGGSGEALVKVIERLIQIMARTLIASKITVRLNEIVMRDHFGAGGGVGALSQPISCKSALWTSECESDLTLPSAFDSLD